MKKILLKLMKLKLHAGNQYGDNIQNLKDKEEWPLWCCGDFAVSPSWYKSDPEEAYSKVAMIIQTDLHGSFIRYRYGFINFEQPCALYTYVQGWDWWCWA